MQVQVFPDVMASDADAVRMPPLDRNDMWSVSIYDQSSGSRTSRLTPVQPMLCEHSTVVSQSFSEARARPVPTPCRSHAMPVSLRSLDGARHRPQLELTPKEEWIGPTLLEEAVKLDGTAIFEARVLVETLIEHFAEQETHSVTQETGERKVHVCLDDLVPPSAYQAAALHLQSLIPARVQGGNDWDAEDWLDADLRPYLKDSRICAKWRKYFAHMPRWGALLVRTTGLRRFLIYTDGSAAGQDITDILPAAWAFAVWAECETGLFFVGGCAHTTAPPSTPFYLGELHEDALTAELLALAWALVWSLEFGYRAGVPIMFRYDATSAGGGVFGSQQLPKTHTVEGAGLAPFVLQLRLSLMQRAVVEHQHVKGHSGELGNELCDIMAKYSRKHPSSAYDRCLPTWPAEWCAHELWSWGWLAVSSGVQYPALSALEAEASRLQQLPRKTAVPALGTQLKTFRAADILYQVSCATYNVLTLFDPGAAKGRSARSSDPGLMIAGKRDVLKGQFRQKGLWFIGLQETRLPTSAVLPDKDFLMLNSEADAQGQHGCALWINLDFVYAVEAGVKHKLQRDQVVMTSLSHRHLQVIIEAPRLKLAVLVLHAPKIMAQGVDFVEAFWKERARELKVHSRTFECVVLADANAHIGSITSDHIGTAGAEDENQEGCLFQQFLCQVGCFVPSTFGEIHTGAHWTWCAPGADGVKRRLDYIAVPLSWKSFEQKTQVWYGFESLQARRDHMPVLYSSSFCKAQPAASYSTSRRHSVRPPRELAAEDRQRFSCQLAAQPLVPWLVDIDAQYNCKVQQLTAVGQQFVEPPKLRPTNSYLTQGTLELVYIRREYRAYLGAEEIELQNRLMMVGFAAFHLLRRGRVFTDSMQRQVASWLTDIDHSLAHALERYGELTVAIRAAVKRDRVRYLESLTTDISLQDLRRPRALYAAVRKAFPKAASARKSLFQPLPAVRLEDGTLARGPEERALRWTAFFQAQEAGLQVTSKEFQDRFLDSGKAVFPEGPVFDVRALPGLGEFEQQLHATKYGKASGPDAVTAELLRVSVPQTAAFLFPVCLKAALQVQEPVEWRGGALMCLAKRAAAAYECRAFRSILIASVVSKAQHRLLRSKLMPSFRDYKTVLQSGQMAGTGVDSLSLLVRTYQLRAQQSRCACSLTFFDVKAAFYRVIRQALIKTPDEPNDKDFLAVLHDLGVPAHALPELVSHLQHMTVLAEAGVSSHLQSQVSDLFQGSWFRMDGAGPYPSGYAARGPAGGPIIRILLLCLSPLCGEGVGE